MGARRRWGFSPDLPCAPQLEGHSLPTWNSGELFLSSACGVQRFQVDLFAWLRQLHQLCRRWRLCSTCDAASRNFKNIREKRIERPETYSTDPGHRNHFFDPASEFLSTHWWSQNPACQRCFYKPLKNCHPASGFLKYSARNRPKNIFPYWDFILDFLTLKRFHVDFLRDFILIFN